jgi:hypothetical protein
MLTSADFLRSFMGEYVNAIQSGSTYDLAYKLALTNSAARFRVNCVKNVQELKLRLIISQGRIGGFPPELLSLVNTLGISVAEDQITETFVSTLDGTLINRGFDEASTNSILLKHIEYLNKGYIFPRIACECDTPEQDPCRTITSMTANTSVSYALPEDVEAQLTDRIENLLNNTSGTSYDIENITTSDVQEIQDKIIDTLNILYSNGNIRTDPNSGRSAAIIQDFFSQMSTPDPNDPNKIMGFSGSDFAVLLTLIGGGKSS